MPALLLENVEVIYDKVFLAIKGVSLEVKEGEMVALLGSNGAGKSTTLKSISGLLGPERGLVTRGDVQYGGKSIVNMGAPERVKMGLVHVLEGRRIFGHLTPDENLTAAYHGRSNARFNELRDQVYTYFPRLKERIKSKAGYLSGGEQQMLAIARALMSRPKLIMFDEPSLGLAPNIVEKTFDIIKDVRKAGTTVLMVEQNAFAALDMCDRAYLYESGRMTLQGTGQEMISDPHVRQAYLGG